MRESNARLEQRLERLELVSQLAAVRSTGSEGSASQGSQSSSGEAPPELVVVKLKPKSEAAPKLPVAVDVQEPSPDLVEALASTTFSNGPAASEPLEQDPDLLDVAFEQAVANLRTGNVQLGVARLEAFAEQNPSHARADNALYFAALGRVGLDDHESGAKLLEQLVAKYPAGDAVQDGLLKLAECRIRLNQPADARALYTRLLTLFPGTAAAAQAEQRLAALSR